MFRFDSDECSDYFLELLCSVTYLQSRFRENVMRVNVHTMFAVVEKIHSKNPRSKFYTNPSLKFLIESPQVLRRPCWGFAHRPLDHYQTHQLSNLCMKCSIMCRDSSERRKSTGSRRRSHQGPSTRYCSIFLSSGSMIPLPLTTSLSTRCIWITAAASCITAVSTSGLVHKP
jgi:hypothetical protein